MVFNESGLYMKHESGFQMHFAATDALKEVAHTPPDVTIAAHKTWSERNAEQLEKLQDEALLAGTQTRPWDWTYATPYRGTAPSESVQPSTERIDIARLKQPDPILFWDDCILYEDELSDNGQAILSVKIVRPDELTYSYSPSVSCHLACLSSSVISFVSIL